MYYSGILTTHLPYLLLTVVYVAYWAIFSFARPEHEPKVTAVSEIRISVTAQNHTIEKASAYRFADFGKTEVPTERSYRYQPVVLSERVHYLPPEQLFNSLFIGSSLFSRPPPGAA